MKIIVRAYYANGTQILGNGDGQLITEAVHFRRTAWYKALHTRKTMKSVAMYKLFVIRANNSEELIDIVKRNS